jgi:signal transduction histidine kinase
MSARLQDLVLLVLVAGAITAVIRIGTSGTETAKGRRGRLRQLCWCAALLGLSVMVARTLNAHYGLTRWLVIPVAAAIIIALWPRLAARIVPVAMILYGLSGFVVVRDAFEGGVSSYGLTMVTNQTGAGLILPQAYALLLLGGWLTLRSADPVLVRARLRLGPVAGAPLGQQLRTLALVPVAAILAGLVAPRLWLAGGAALILTVALLVGVLLLIRRWPARSAQLATAGLLCLGIAGLVITAAWRSSSVPITRWCAISLRPVFNQIASAQPEKPSPAQSVTLPSAPRLTLPRALSLKPPSALAGPSALVVKRPPAQPSKLVCHISPPAFVAGPIGTDVADVVWGQAVPYGAVLVDSQSTADLAAVEGLAFLALGTWLAPQTFPLIRRMLGGAPDTELTKRVERLTQSRAVAVDTASADLRRLERDLHDGAQARLVALGMSLRAAERLIPTSPEAAIALVAEARETSMKALTELRELVRGVVPPVLADRGLADAVRALALDSPLHVETDVDLPGRVPAPVETACYFAMAELLTNAAKHSGSRDARIAVSHSGRLLRIEVTDFGLGGADPARGSGLAGVEKRLATFDGILAVNSPAGGPTMIVMEVPCALSSPRTSSC